jgi:hypothetical protein
MPRRCLRVLSALWHTLRAGREHRVALQAFIGAPESTPGNPSRRVPFRRSPADGLAPSRRRRGLAVEPMTCAPNAFQSSDGLVRLDPGQSLTTRWGGPACLTVGDFVTGTLRTSRGRTSANGRPATQRGSMCPTFDFSATATLRFAISLRRASRRAKRESSVMSRNPVDASHTA